jgi:hypothetical protein
MKFTIFASVLIVANALTVVQKTKGAEEKMNPVTKVVKMLEEMKATAEKEAKEDEDIYETMECWCTTNDKEKTEAIKIAEARIEELTATIETGIAKAGELTTQIAGLKEDIAADQDALAEATSIRDKEKADFDAEDADLSETAKLLKEAIAILSKVQLAQKSKADKAAAAPADAAQETQALVQVHDLVKRATSSPRKTTGAYYSVMQKDLWDLLSTLPHAPVADAPHVITGLSQQPTGRAAGVTSYSAQSSSIFGILEEMFSEITRDLSAAQKAEINAAIAFQRLRATKEGEIEAATKSMEEKDAELADTNQKVAQAKEDLVETKDALAADEKFLMDLKKRCKTADADYAARSKTRQDEILAITEAINILTTDEAKDLISKSTVFLQTRSSHQQHKANRAATSEVSIRQHAASQLLQVAKRHSGTSGGWNLALLAVSTQLDGFEKVKAMMDKMIVELKKQQEEEYEKHETCKKDIQSNEMSTLEKETEKKDLEAKIADLTAQLESLTKELEELNMEVSEAHVSLKRAGMNRKEENHEFQQMISDQRATIEVLHKALDRLNDFYKEGSLIAIRAHGRQPVPGAAVEPPPPAGKDFQKSEMAPGVIQTLEKIIQEAEIADKEAVAAEQKSQEAYSEFVANTNAALDAYAKAIATNTENKEKATADKLQSGEDLKATDTAIGELQDTSKALHLNCDYLLKNYDVRQEARGQEIAAIQEAKQILSGADFGF